jgi:hypothetical protein
MNSIYADLCVMPVKELMGYAKHFSIIIGNGKTKHQIIGAILEKLLKGGKG